MRHGFLNWIVIALIGSTLSGCGTMANLDGRDTMIGFPSRPPVPFGGVANDVNWMTRGTINPPEKYDKGFTGIIGAADLPFSLVGDLVTLPWTTFEFTREQLAPSDRYVKHLRHPAGKNQPLEVGAEPEEEPVLQAGTSR